MKPFKLFSIAIFITLLIYSCSYEFVYTKNSKWVYYDGVDSIEVYIHKNTLFGDVIVKDSLNIDSANIIGKAKRVYLFPVK